MRFRIRSATPSDAPALAGLIRELAAYERLSHEAEPDADALAKHLADDASPRCNAFIAEADGEPLAFALYFYSYSTFLTRWGVYLEDLYVRPEHRGKGIGYALLRRVAQEAVSRGCRRMEWAVLNWNEPAIAFYRRIGARPMDDWTTMRLSGEALERIGAQDGMDGAAGA